MPDSLRRSFCMVFCALLPAVAVGQTTATLSGSVVDGTQSALPGATVAIRQVDTGSQRAATTGPQGRYRVTALEPGEYSVTVEMDGFQRSIRNGIRLSIGQNAVVNFELRIGNLEEEVTVSGEVSLVETTSGGVTGLIEQKQMSELPLNGRDFSQLTLLQPGVTASLTTARAVDRGQGTQVSVAGARPNQISVVLDGADVNSQGNQTPGSAAGGFLGVDAIREFRVVVNGYAAEYGASAGGIVSAVTRSGTNDFHGGAFEFHRNDAFDEKTFFDPVDEPIPPFTRNQFGAFLSGPLVKDRTFFMVSYEGVRQDLSRTEIARVPSTATRNRADINPAIRPYMELYPLPNGDDSGQSGTFTHQLKDIIKEDYFIVRLDHRLSDDDWLSVRYLHDVSTAARPETLGLWETTEKTKGQFATAEYRRVFGPRWLNEFRVSFNRPYEETANTGDFPDDPALYFIPGTRIGAISVSGLTGLGPNDASPTFFDYKSLQLIEDVTYTRDQHTFKAGVRFSRWFNNQDSSFQYGGAYSFGAIEDFVRNVTDTFEGIVPGGTTAREWRQNLFGIYVQDDFQVSPRLTLNLGVRYESFTSPTETQGRVAHFDTGYPVDDPAAQDQAVTVGPPLFNAPSGKLAPRVGFAWDVFGDGRTSLRGGFGYFFEPLRGNFWRTYGNRQPPLVEQANIPSPPFPDPFSGSIEVRNRLDLFDFNPAYPKRLQYSATLQQQFWGDAVVSISYLGSRGYDQVVNIEANHSVPIRQADGSLFFPEPPRGERLLPRRNPNFENIRLRTPAGHSWYNGLAVGVVKRFGGGILQAAYTFGKSTDEGSQSVGSSDFSNSNQPPYGYDLAMNKGPSAFDVRHNFVLNYTWELPFGNDLDGLARTLVHGWQVSGILTIRSGIPFSPEIDIDRARARPRRRGGGQRPSWASGFGPDNAVLGGSEQYFDPAAFVLPAPGTFGDVPRNALYGPGYATWDMAVFKNFDFNGRYRLQLRFEGYNLLNRTNLGLPENIVFDRRGRVNESAGEITSIIGTARQLQLGVKLTF